MLKEPPSDPDRSDSSGERSSLDEPERSSLDGIEGSSLDSIEGSSLDSIERSSLDEIIELYKRDVDRTLLREQLRKTPDQRVRELVELERFAEELRRAGRKAFR